MHQSTTIKSIFVYFFLAISFLLCTACSSAYFLPSNDVKTAHTEEPNAQAEELLPGQFEDQNLANIVYDSQKLGDYSIATLKEVNATSQHIKSLWGLEHYTNLRKLFLGINQISNLEPLAVLNNLVELSLAYNNVISINALDNLTKLDKLYLNNNSIENIISLYPLIQITYLNLSYNLISNISTISRLTKLQTLKLNNNKIQDIKYLANLTSLQELALSNNQIASVSTLFSLKELTSLTLAHNKIKSIVNISQLTNLIYLDISGNDPVLLTGENLAQINILKNRGCTVIHD
jgi:internalin A